MWGDSPETYRIRHLPTQCTVDYFAKVFNIPNQYEEKGQPFIDRIIKANREDAPIPSVDDYCKD
jgi:hypothetical protein